MRLNIPLLQAAIIAEEEKKRSTQFEVATQPSKSRVRHDVGNTHHFSGGSKQRSLVSKDDITVRLNYDDVVTLRTFDTYPHPQDGNHGQSVTLRPTMSTLSPNSISSDQLPIASDPSFSVQRKTPILEEQKQSAFRKSSGRGLSSNSNGTQLLPVPIPFRSPPHDDDMSHFSFFADKPRSPPEQSNRNYFVTNSNSERGPKRSRPFDRSPRNIDFKSRVTEWCSNNVISGYHQIKTNTSSVKNKIS